MLHMSTRPTSEQRPRRRHDAARRERLTKVIRYMLEHGTLASGDQALLAALFDLSRQRVNQLVTQQRRLMNESGAPGAVENTEPSERMPR